MQEKNNRKLYSMKRILTLLSFLTLLGSCISTTKKTTNMDDQKKQVEKQTAPLDTTPKVTGIGGIFFYADNPKETKEWYAKNLGIEMNAWGSSSFESRSIDNPDQVNSLQWKPFKTGDEYFSPSKKDFMINYQVQNLVGLVDKLKENGVTILDTIVTYDFGKFVHIMDAEDNKIELWEPTE